MFAQCSLTHVSFFLLWRSFAYIFHLPKHQSAKSCISVKRFFSTGYTRASHSIISVPQPLTADRRTVVNDVTWKARLSGVWWFLFQFISRYWPYSMSWIKMQWHGMSVLLRTTKFHSAVYHNDKKSSLFSWTGCFCEEFVDWKASFIRQTSMDLSCNVRAVST